MPFSEKTVEHKEFGRISIVRSTRANRISISMKPFQPLKLTIPMLVSTKRAEEFLLQKEGWILKNLKKIRTLEDNYTVFTEDSKFRTLEHDLEILRFSESIPRTSLKNNKILVWLPEKSDVTDLQIQEMIRTGIQEAWRKEAKKYLPVRLAELSQKYRLPYNKVTIRNNKSRWGSCSHTNNINLSLHLMRLPQHLIDYILVHELTHTIHKNHSKNFWNDLERMFPGARIADRKLKDYRMDIY